MASMVALWRCKCGTRIKVIAEIDSSPPATQMASCPQCHETRPISVDRIITVMKDSSDVSPAAGCEAKERLLAAQKKALDNYSRGAKELAEAVAMLAHTEFEFVAKRVRTARQALLETNQQLEEHIARHGC